MIMSYLNICDLVSTPFVLFASTLMKSYTCAVNEVTNGGHGGHKNAKVVLSIL